MSGQFVLTPGEIREEKVLEEKVDEDDEKIARGCYYTWRSNRRVSHGKLSPLRIACLI